MPIYKTSVKKDGLQQYRVRVNYTDRSGKYRQVERTVYGKAQALEVERQLIAECRGGDKASSGKMTVLALYNEYIQMKQHQVRETTMRQIVGCLTRYVLPKLQDYSLEDLSPAVLQKWVNSVNETDLSVTTKRHAYATLNAMLGYAVKMEYIPKSPLQKVDNFRDVYAVEEQEKLHYYTPEQFNKFIAAAWKEGAETGKWQYYVFFCIAYFTGCRKGEINALKWSDLDGDRLNVRRSVTQKIKGSPIVETPPKNKSSYRSLQVPTPLMTVLEAQKRRQQEAYPDWSEDFRICGGRECVSDTSLENRNIAYAEEAGLEHIRIHDFRHSHASLLVNEGVNIQEVARRLGHSNIKQTWQTYAHLYPREEERAVRVLNEIELPDAEPTVTNPHS